MVSPAPGSQDVISAPALDAPSPVPLVTDENSVCDESQQQSGSSDTVLNLPDMLVKRSHRSVCDQGQAGESRKKVALAQRQCRNPSSDTVLDLPAVLVDQYDHDLSTHDTNHVGAKSATLDVPHLQAGC